MSRRKAAELGLRPLGALRSYRVVGVPPDEMGVGPAVAIPAALDGAGLGMGDVDVFEINEAFAAQAAYCVRKLGIPAHKVNPHGGAIPLRHPHGCTGARQVATHLHELRRRRARYGVVSMCIGTGWAPPPSSRPSKNIYMRAARPRRTSADAARHHPWDHVGRDIDDRARGHG